MPAAAPAHSNYERAGTARDCLDLRPSGRPSRLNHRVGGPCAWTAESLGAAHWTIPVPPGACAEIQAVAEKLRCDPLPMLRLSPGLFALDECRRMMERVKRELDDGTGFVLLDGLPLDALSADEARSVYWVLGRLLSSPVATKWDGTMLYDVTDTGAAHGVRRARRGDQRRARVPQRQRIRSRGARLRQPDVPAAGSVGGHDTAVQPLHGAQHAARRRSGPCLRASTSRSTSTARPSTRPAPHASPARPCSASTDPGCWPGVARSLIHNGYTLLGETLDRDGARSIDAVDAIMRDDRNFVTFSMRRGQVQFLNNRFIAHHRSRFEDDPDPERKRHLVRMWYRDTGAAFYDG